MTAMTLRLTDEKHTRLKAMASSRGVSVNKVLDEAVTLMLAEFDTKMRFQIRANRGDVNKGLALLEKAMK